VDISFCLFGINFINGNYSTAYRRLANGELMIVPSGPGLATIGKDIIYTKAVQNSDFAIPDSSYMILLLRLLKGIKIKKLSGYKFLINFFSEDFKKNDLFLIDPNEKESQVNNLYLNKVGIPIDISHHYVAPVYEQGKYIDQKLLSILNNMKHKPKFIMINLGSNVQEPLGYYLKKNLNFKPGILGTGAAIAFLTGGQAPISPTIDRLGLGWIWRCIKNPIKYLPRYIMALNLFKLILKEKVIINSQ